MVHESLDQLLKSVEHVGGDWLVYKIVRLQGSHQPSFVLAPARYEHFLPSAYWSDTVTVRRCGVLGCGKWSVADANSQQLVFDSFRETIKELGVQPVG